MPCKSGLIKKKKNSLAIQMKAIFEQENLKHLHQIFFSFFAFRAHP